MIAVVRLGLGAAFSLAVGFVAWLASWVFQRPSLASDGLFLTQGIVTGIAVGTVAAFFWWNLETPRGVRWALAGAVVAAGVVAPIVALALGDVETYNTLVGPSKRLPAIVMGDLISTMILSSALAANVVAAGSGIYRMVRYREV